MAAPAPMPPSNYPTAPPPDPGAPGGYPPPAYSTWGSAPGPYRGPGLPAWLSFGGILVLVGGVLVLVGFLVGVIANATVATSAATNAAQTYYNELAAFDALVGIGLFLAFLGWLFHQMSRHRQMLH